MRWEDCLVCYRFNPLPSRLTLDFSDIFEDGFAFDSIDGLAELENSKIHSNNFEIKGLLLISLLRVTSISKMKHKTWLLPLHLMSQTQCLSQHLQEDRLLERQLLYFKKLLNDPLNEVLTDQYRLTGSWLTPQETPIDRDTLKNVGEGITDQIDEQIINPPPKSCLK